MALCRSILLSVLSQNTTLFEDLRTANCQGVWPLHTSVERKQVRLPSPNRLQNRPPPEPPHLPAALAVPSATAAHARPLPWRSGLSYHSAADVCLLRARLRTCARCLYSAPHGLGQSHLSTSAPVWPSWQVLEHWKASTDLNGRMHRIYNPCGRLRQFFFPSEKCAVFPEVSALRVHYGNCWLPHFHFHRWSPCVGGRKPTRC